MANTNKGSYSPIIREELDANPKIATKRLARLLCNKYPEIFDNLEKARSRVRYVRGAIGTRNLHEIRFVSKYRRTKVEGDICRKWGELIPKTKANEWLWHELPEKVKRWLVIADLHFPYHDKEALCTALEHAAGNCDGILINGDAMDFYQASNFCRDPRKNGVDKEIEIFGKFLDNLKQMRVKHIVWKGGNHEYRLEHYKWQKCPELAGLECLTIPKLLNLADRGVEWIPWSHGIRHHQLAIVHGHEWAKGFVAPVNPARGAFLRAGECTLSAHLHRKSNHPQKSIFGRLVQCWSIGCLCNLHPDYAPLNNWDHGFAYLNSGSEWSVENHSIINGKVK